MSSSPLVAANLSNDARKGLAILSLSKAEPITHLADREGVSRQFLYRQKQKAAEALDEAFAAKDDGVLFYLPVTEAWLNQLTLALILVCRSSYRGVKELLRDLFNIPISVGTIHNRLQSAAEHRSGAKRLQRVAQAIESVLSDREVLRETVHDIVRDFIEHERRHIAMEERDFFPAAVRALQPQEWAGIASRLTDRKDPLFSETVEESFLPCEGIS